MEFRRATVEEILEAARLVMPTLPRSTSQARKTIETAPRSMGVDFRCQTVAVDNGRIVAACLHILAPGHCATILPPGVSGQLGGSERDRAAAGLIRASVQTCRDEGATLLQSLLPEGPEEYPATTYLAAGFEHLTMLEYLEIDVGKKPAAADAGPWTWETYHDELEGEFTRLLEATYVDSLDCPGIDALRTSQDALDSHRASGLFTPQGWLLARCDGQAAGMVLVNRVASRRACELVYMGVAPQFRGRGLGQLLVQQAMGRSRLLKEPVLTVAVDVANTPARSLYLKAGMHVVNRRHVYYVPSQCR
ncbi:MAG: GNAT family N-acetyltransferase [Planctomycetes bacterium]|nr:GNAT family N-acetyltransferase [Planctomycetota bacterium]